MPFARPCARTSSRFSATACESRWRGRLVLPDRHPNARPIMAIPLNLPSDRLFPAHGATRILARRLYATVKDLPIVSPHGHTDPQWFADDAPFANASALLITPDHYVFRMLYSQGLRLEDLGIARRVAGGGEPDARRIWHAFAANYHLFRGTPTRICLDHAFNTELDI